MPMHVRLMTEIVPGEIILESATPGGTDRFFAVGAGLVEVGADHVTILTDMAVPAERIDEAAVEEARQRAEARLQDKISDEEIASVNASLARALAQLHVKRRGRL